MYASGGGVHPTDLERVINYTVSVSQGTKAQAKKADIKVWGDPTVLNVAKLQGDDAKAFAAVTGPGAVTIPCPAILEPHASFVKLIEESWLAKYGQG